VSKSIGGGKPGRAATALAYAERLGRHFSNIVEWISWPDTELRQLLKARKRTVAIEDWQTSCDWRRILIAWVTPYIRRCQAAHARSSPSAGGTAVIVLRIALGTGGQDRGQTAYSHGLRAGSKLGLVSSLHNSLLRKPGHHQFSRSRMLSSFGRRQPVSDNGDV
jgi:hypothetical protein